MKPLVLCLLAVALTAAPAERTFTGTITDSQCARGDHSQMQMEPTNAGCVKACVEEHSATYVLFTGKETYELSDQKTPEKFAGQKVKVTGRLDAKTRTIAVDSIAAAR